MSLFEELINVLTAGAIVLAMITSYLVANKLWSRKHEKVVAESISVSAQLIGILTMLPFLAKYILLDDDYMSFASLAIRLVLTFFFLAIGIGLWVAVARRESLWTKTRRALRLERKESLDLVNALIRPSGARIMLDVLQKLALIDKQLDAREKAFVQDFADRWNIKIEFEKQFEKATETPTERMYIDLRQRLSDYLSVTPDRTQVGQFLDIIELLIGIDQKISEEEQFIVEEIRGMLQTYINEGEAGETFSVVVVPQDREEREAIRTLLPNARSHARWGGEVYYAGVYHSRGYAEMISRKYQALNLFSTVKAL
jgi:hypothetical protein